MIHERSNVHWYDIYFVDISSFSLIRFSLSFHHFSFLFLWNVVMRVSCDSPSLILIYAHWARRDLIIGAETEITPSVTFDYSPLTLRCSTIFFPLLDILSRCGMLIPNLPFRFDQITKRLSFENVSNSYGNIFQKRSSWYSDLCEYK